jgi:hypothetical protein
MMVADTQTSVSLPGRSGFQGAITRYLVMLVRLRARQQAGVVGRRALVFLHDLLAFLDDPDDGIAGRVQDYHSLEAARPHRRAPLDLPAARPAQIEWERRFSDSTRSKRLNISAWQDHPLLAAQKGEQYLDPLM